MVALPTDNPARPAKAADDRTLDSWKEIADFLGVSVRTAHRWKEASGMPVHRAPSGHVFARPEELERWRRGLARKPDRRWVRWAAVAAAVLSALAALLLWRTASAGPPATATLDGQTVHALDEEGRVRWSVTIPDLGPRHDWGWQVSEPDRTLVADIDGDGEVEVIVNVMPLTHPDKPGRLVCYSQDGQVRWEFVPGRYVKDANGEYSHDYLPHIVRLVRAGGKPYVLTSATHRRWAPTQVALLDPANGKVIEEFWHPGAITHALVVDVGGDGTPDLMLAGVNNPGAGPGSPVVMALGLPFSVVPPVADSLMAGLGSGGPRTYIVLPRPDVSVVQGAVATILKLLFEEPATILVQTRYTKDKETVLHYRFDRDLRLRGFFESIDAPTAHDTLWRAGLLSHPFSPEERAWLQGVRHFTYVPDGNAGLIPPFQPGS